MKPDRLRPGGWIADRFRYRAAQRTRASQLDREVERNLAGALADWEGTERLLGECRHGCNGSHVELGYPVESCNWQCHPGVELDPERAARFDAMLAKFPVL